MSNSIQEPLSRRVPRHIMNGSTLGLALSCVSLMPAAAQTVSQAPTELPAISVEGQAPAESSYKADQVQSPKMTAPLVDTPRSVTVIPQQVMSDRAQTSLQEVLRTTPGITLGSGEGGNPSSDRPFIRGFDAQTDTFVDGVRDVGSQTREIFNIEQVEISKGPGSAFSGRGSTGGSINLVSKTPRAENFIAGSATIGTDMTKRLTGDVNQMVTDSVAVRLNAMVHDGDVAGRDEVEVSRWGIAPSVTVGLNGPTRATFSFYHLQTDDMIDYGLPYDPRTGKPAAVDRSNFYGLVNRDFQKTQVDIGTIRLEHDLTSSLTLRNTTRYGWSENDYIATNPDDSAGNVARGFVWRSPKSRNADTKTFINQTDLYGDFETGSLKHSFSTGVEFSREKVGNRGYAVASGSRTCTAVAPPYNCTSLFDPNPEDPWTGSITQAATYTDTTSKTAAAYIFDTVQLNEQWSVNLGLRFDHFETKAEPADLENISNFLNYQAGVVYKPLPNGSVYATYATSSNPVGENAGEGLSSIAAGNATLDPEENRSIELGTKWELFNRRLLLSGAIFQTEKTNARVSATTERNAPQVQVGEQRIRGFELGASGDITSNWHVFAGYVFLDSKTVDAGPAGAASQGKDFPNTPRHSFNIWSTYDVTDAATIGGGVNYVGKRYANTTNTIYVPSYWRFDAMASYQVTENVAVQLNVLNLLNERYFDKPFTTHMASVAPGRTALLSTSFKF